MASMNYRLESVSIRGFRAFGEEQKIRISGRHLLLLGANGSGKSSIVEAIRWCLFGAPSGSDESEFRNAFYGAGDCHVELTLAGPGGPVRVLRKLRPGSARSDATYTKPDGTNASKDELFPNLVRLGPPQGVYIIFAAEQRTQSTPHRSISEFDRVLYSYLRVEDIPDLLKHIDMLVEEETVVSERLAKEISGVEEFLRQKLSQIQLQLDELLRQPPWEGSRPPTTAETDARVQGKVEELRHLVQASPPSETSNDRLLDHAERWIKQLTATKSSELECKLNDLRSRAHELARQWKEKLDAEVLIAHQEEEERQLTQELSMLLAGSTVEQLEQMLDARTKRARKGEIRLMIAIEAEKYCRLHSPTECPVCSTQMTLDQLASAVRLAIEQEKPFQADQENELERLRDKVGRARELQDKLTRLNMECAKSQEMLSKAIIALQSPTGISDVRHITEAMVKARIDTVEKSVQSLQEQLRSDQSSFTELTKELGDLRTEARFQKYRAQQVRISERLSSGLEPTHLLYAEFLDMVDTVREIRQTLLDVFNEELDRTLPAMSKMMTEIYQNLTEQPSFGRVYLRRTSEGPLERNLFVSVGSERIPDHFFDPEDVLNGQAISALRLVPYFAFTPLRVGKIELDLLLIDDPSQSFDTSRVRLLLKEFARVGAHAQLVIATHEVGRFIPEVWQFFSHKELTALKITNFEPVKGPTLVVEQ